MTQRSLVNFLGSMAELTGADESTRVCAVTTVCFDIAALELFLPAWVGGRLVVASEETARDPDALSALMQSQKVLTLCTLYPAPYILHPISYILYPIPYTLYPIPYTLNRRA